MIILCLCSQIYIYFLMIKYFIIKLFISTWNLDLCNWLVSLFTFSIIIIHFFLINLLFFRFAIPTYLFLTDWSRCSKVVAQTVGNFYYNEVSRAYIEVFSIYTEGEKKEFYYLLVLRKPYISDKASAMLISLLIHYFHLFMYHLCFVTFLVEAASVYFTTSILLRESFVFTYCSVIF